MGPTDTRQVVLLKSLETQNRFYALADPARGWKNADTIERFPDDLPLGIAYPCLEDGLNDFAVIRSTFDTLQLFPDDAELRAELTSIIEDARGNLLRRLGELRCRLSSGQARFLGTDLVEFKAYLMNLVAKGAVRSLLDNMMKLDVFGSVAAIEADRDMRPPELAYFYRFRSEGEAEAQGRADQLPFVAALFADLIEEVRDHSNYADRYRFDRDVFQKFIALMFVNYATTDPVFYGTAKGDYAVSSERDMQETPLYQAIASALREAFPEQAGTAQEPRVWCPRAFAGAVPSADQPLMQPLTAVAEAIRLLGQVEHPRAAEAQQVILRACEQLFTCLQDLNVVAPLTEDPFRRVLEAETHAAPAGSRLRVLVAEDSAVNQRVAARMLEQRGCQVVVVANGREALAALERGPFDAAVLDIQMPEMDGYQAATALREREAAIGARARLPLIAMSAYAVDAVRDRCLASGMDAFVAKPLNRRELYAALDRVTSPFATPEASESALRQELPDWAEVLERFDGDVEMLREVVADFLADAPRQLAELDGAIARRDARAVEHTAHSLKGAIGNFAVRGAYEAARQLEAMGLAGDLAGAEAALGELKDELEQLKPALSALTRAESID